MKRKTVVLSSAASTDARGRPTLWERWRLGVKVALVAVLVGCTTVPETGRTAFNFMSNEQLAPMAAQQFLQMRQEIPPTRNAALQARVQRIGERIVVAARGRGANIQPPEQWEFVVFADPQLNAFAMPGGKVGFYEGILALMETDDEIAVVMGHEVGHVVANHGGERVSQQLGISAIGLGLQLGLGQSELGGSTQQAILVAYGIGSGVGLLKYSRDHESEADTLGLIYMAEAGYNPTAALTFWGKMEAKAGGAAGVPEFLSTHPSHGTRIRDIQAKLPEVMPIYEANRGRFERVSQR